MSAPSRRWPRVRFRLWHLFVLVTLLCAWLGYETNRARKIEAVIAAVHKSEGCISYKMRFSDGFWWDESDGRTAYLGRPKSPAPKWMIDFLGPYYFIRPTAISIPANHPCNDLLPGICSLTSLESLTVYCWSNDNLQALKGLQDLKHLDLSGNVDDDSIALLGSIKSLRMLLITRAYISQQGARQLRESLPECRVMSERRRFPVPEVRYQLGASVE